MTQDVKEGRGAISLADLAILIGRGESREYMYTNKLTAHFSGETGTHPTRSYHGLCVRMEKLLEDWRFQLGGVALEPEKAVRTLAFPHLLVRIYDNPEVREKICLPNGRNVLMVELRARVEAEGALCPLVDLRPVRQVIKPGYGIIWRPRENILYIRSLTAGRGSSQGSLWFGVTASLPLEFISQERYMSRSYIRGQRRGVMGHGTPFCPGKLRFRLSEGKGLFLFVAGRTRAEVKSSAERVLRGSSEIIRLKGRRLQRLLSRCWVISSDSRLNRALAWARISLDALIMKQCGPGIYAGLPWFANYWGRDTAISLPGATMVTGQFALAKKLLFSMARNQDRRAGSRTFGRIPNLLEPGTKLFNTADGTLWFLRELEEYLRYCGDVSTARNLFPMVKMAIEGEISCRTDTNGLAVHQAAETWMDAGGENRPVTPREDRAVEIQVLWHTALLSAARLAQLVDRKTSALRWKRLAKRVREAFLIRFWDSEGQRLYDHLNPDGTPDEQIRPNELFALTVPFRAILTQERERAILDRVMRRLVYSHGVSTLVSDDVQFRSRHLSGGRYHFDEAYHNGDVWLWLAGPLISALVRHGRKETANLLTETLTGHLLDRGAVGTLSELFNAFPTKEYDNEAGTFTQAWSLAEYIRVIFQDYLGVRPDVLAGELVIEPAVPLAWGDVNFQFAIQQGLVEAQYARSESSQTYDFRAYDIPNGLHLQLRARLSGGKLLVVRRPVRAGRRETIQIRPHGRSWRAFANGKVVRCHIQPTPFDIAREESPIFRKPPRRRSKA